MGSGLIAAGALTRESDQHQMNLFSEFHWNLSVNY
jgi:hypothetical protein